jgi:hypothetical protein
MDLTHYRDRAVEAARDGAALPFIAWLVFAVVTVLALAVLGGR